MTQYPTEQELKLAVALNYDGTCTPTLIAKGDDELATEISALATEHDIPIWDNPLLAEVLYRLEVGDEIPEELYLAVAHIIALAYRIRNDPDISSDHNRNQQSR